MKTIKLLCASALAVASVGIASAQTPVKITGSTALRKATYFAIVNSLNSPAAAAIGGDTTGNDMSGAGRAIITGTLKTGTNSGSSVAYQLAWAGSVGGTKAVAQGLSTIPDASFDSAHTWMSTGNSRTPVSIVSGKIQGWTEIAAGSAAFDTATAPDAANSDVNKSLYPFSTSNLTEKNGAGVGVIQFYWVKGRKHPDITNTTSYEGLTNVTQLQGQLLLAAGALPLSMFTGDSNDAAIDVLLVGRNNDSGTRVSEEAETGFGFGFGTETQYQPIISGGLITGVTNVGNAGYSSGGSVATALKTAIQAGAVDDFGNPFVFLGYVGKGDKNNAVGGGAVVLTWNGNDGVVDANTQNGKYSAWSTGHAYYLNTIPNGVKKSALNNLADQLLVDVVQSGLPLNTMAVSRSGEGDRNPPAP